MAVRNASADSGSRKTWLVVVSVLALIAVALFLRAYWNIDAATEGGKFVLSGGSDPYYHKRAVDCIQNGGCAPGQEPWTTLIHDPLLNYPYGATNPNPPLFEWSIAVSGWAMAPFFGGDIAESTWWATEWAPAIYGALTVIPIYLIGAALFDRRVGVVAALFWTLSTSAIDATGLGTADHDGAIMFFASLSFLFYIKAIAHFRGDGNWVTNWRDGSSIGSGLGRFFRERRLGLGYSVLTGLSIGAVALIWKGFPYVLGIFFIYAGLQMVLDHWKNRDSTGLWLGTFLAMLIGVLMALPYYNVAEVGNFLRPVWYIIGAFFVAGLVLVPTRDFPTILVMPIALIAAILGAVLAFFVFPDVAKGLLYATVYFKQTALYETIAEAHPANFSNIVFGIGPVPFFAAVTGWVVLLFASRKESTRPILFVLVWGAVALYMAHAAIRFLFNAMPVFAVLGAFMTVWVIDWLGFGSVRKSLAANKGSFWTGIRKGVRPLQIVGVSLIALLLVIPNVMLAADAALPPEDENRFIENSNSQFVKDFIAKRFGAYGQNFIAPYWQDGLAWLDERDAGIAPADRPAFLAWWDYGHWAIAVGNHPTVADNFQNGYQFAANFILAQNETHAIQLLAARLIDLPDANAKAELANIGVADPTAVLEDLHAYRYTSALPMADALKFLKAVETNTGKKIRYFTTDVRMLPYDNPQTPSIEQSSIYYAPVRLAEQDPEDYVQVQIQLAGRPVGDDSSYISKEDFENLARNPITQPSGAGERLRFTQKFFDSMYYRGYVGSPPQGPFPATGDLVAQGLNNPHPGEGLEHFRLVYANDGMKILEFYYGATVKGVVTEGGAPVANAAVTVLDDSGKLLFDGFNEAAKAQLTPEEFNSAHMEVITDANGAYELTAPFGDVVTIVASKDGVELARTTLNITREQAAQGTEFVTNLSSEPGSITGTLFEDSNANSTYEQGLDKPLADTTITIGGKSAVTNSEGVFTIADIPSGIQEVSVNDPRYDVSPRTARVRVEPGVTNTANISLELKPAKVTGTAFADSDNNAAANDGEMLAQQVLVFTADDTVADNTARSTSATTDFSGNYTVTLAAGSYVVTSTYTTAAGDVYEINAALVVEVGEAKTYPVRLVKTA